MQRRKALLDGVAIAFLILVLVVFVGGMFIFIGKALKDCSVRYVYKDFVT